MSSTTVQFFDCLCRTCMQEVVEVANLNTEQQWKSIFDTIEDCYALQIAELLSNAIPLIEVQLNDELPKKICSKCLQQLLSVYRFQQMCTQSDQQMRALIAKESTDSKISLKKDPSVKDVIDPNELLKQQMILDANEHRIEFGSINALPELQQASAADPLQSIEVTLEQSKEAEPKDISMFLKHDSNDASNVDHADEPNADYSDGEALPSAKKQKRHRAEQTQSLSNKQMDKSLPPIVCDICGKTFRKPAWLKKHTKKYHSADSPKKPLIPCDLCDETYISKSSLAKHKKLRHTKEKKQKPFKRYKCDFCDETFTRYEIANHRKQQHPLEKPPRKHQCHLCDKSFRKPNVLRTHIRRHTGERPYLCTECGKSFCDSNELKHHKSRHTDVKSFECPYCPAKFRCAGDVTSHKIIHDTTKRFICDICAKRFRTSNQLLMHKRWHNNEKPYECDYCEVRFIRMTAKRIHMRTHTGEKPYKCQFCGLAYSAMFSLRKHLRIHLGANVHRCKLCPLAFPSDREMHSHFLSHKHEDTETRERNLKALKEEEAKLKLVFDARAKMTD